MYSMDLLSVGSCIGRSAAANDMPLLYAFKLFRTSHFARSDSKRDYISDTNPSGLAPARKQKWRRIEAKRLGSDQMRKRAARV